MADRIAKIASTVGRAYGSFIKARDEMLRKPQFVADYIQQTAWQGGMFDNTDQATMRAIRNSWVYSDIQMKALDIAMSKIDIYSNPTGLNGEGKQAPGHDFLKVLRRPNPYMGQGLLWQYTHWWMDLRGKSFWFLAPGVGGNIAEIWPLPANKMAMEPTDDNKGIKRWILKLHRWWYLDPKYVCYFRYANPFDFFDGLPPLVAAMLTVDADLAMKTWNGAFFGQDNVMPSAVISLGSGDANRLIDPQDIQAVKEELKSEYQAINRKTIVTNANNMSAALLGWSAKDMDFLNGMAWNRDEIDWCFGVPPGMHDKNSTEANAKVGKGIFKDNMWGLKNIYADEVTNQILKPHYHEDLEARFEDDRIVDRELQLREAALAKEAMSREEWAQKYFNVELQPGDVTMAEGVRNAVTEIKQQQFGDAKDGKKFESKKTDEKVAEKKPISNAVTTKSNEYRPWETDGITEAEYFKRAYLEESKPKKSIADELDLFHRKAVNKFKEKKHCNNLKFVSDVLDEETVKAIQSDLEGVEQRSDIDEIFAHWKSEMKGGQGSGNFDHKGRIGKVGGSSSANRVYIPFDKSKHKNVGAWLEELPPYDPQLKGPNGETVELIRAYDADGWIAIELDIDGNEIRNEFSYRKEEAKRNAASFQNDWFRKSEVEQ